MWFDSFFGDPRTDDLDWPSTFVRLRTTARYTEGEGMEYPVRLRANVRLPRADQRWRLIVTGMNEDEFQSHEEEEDSLDTASGAREEDEPSTRLGLRYTMYKTLRSIFNFGAGLSLNWPVESYVRIRYRHRAVSAVVDPIGKDSATVRFDQPQSSVTPGQGAVFYRGDEVLGGGWIVE